MLRTGQVKSVLFSIAILAGLGGAAALAAQAAIDQEGLVYWSDGDSGRLPDGTKFRLHGVDAPETRSLKQIGGAECEAERESGYIAKERVVDLTRDTQVTVTRDYGRDRYNRLVVDLMVDGEDLATRLVAEGTHQIWDYDGGAPKPDWCNARRAPAQSGPLSP